MTLDALVTVPATCGRFADALRPRRGHAAGAAVVGVPGAFALAGLSGLAYAATFPPLSWAPVAWVALAPLLAACAALPPGRAALAGMCWALAAGAGVTWFLPEMLSRYFGLAAVPSGLAAVAIIAGHHGIFIAAFAAWVAWLVRRGAADPVRLAGGWLACELARSHGVVGSPWALAAYSQVGWAPLIQIADVAGPYGIGLLVAAVNAGVAALVVPGLRGRRPLFTATAIAAALAGTLLYGTWRLGQSFDDGPALGVVVVQGGATPVDPAERAARLERHVALTTRAARAHTRLVVWPEYAIEAYLDEASPTREALVRTAAVTGADLVVGGPHFVPSAAGTRYHNSAYVVRDGRVAGRYDKRRLVPFAEDGYSAGSGSSVLETAALRAGMLVCGESMFPDLARDTARDGAEVLVNLSNDAWFGHAAPARQQLDVTALRAVENRRWLVRAAATGVSAVIDPHGRVVTQSTFGTPQALTAFVHQSHVRTPYQRVGDAFAWMVIAGVVVATVGATHRRSS